MFKADVHASTYWDLKPDSGRAGRLTTFCIRIIKTKDFILKQGCNVFLISIFFFIPCSLFSQDNDVGSENNYVHTVDIQEEERGDRLTIVLI